MKASLARSWAALTRVRATDRDQARRGQVLSILLFTLIGTGSLLLPVTVLIYPSATPAEQQSLLCLPLVIISMLAITSVNRRGNVRAAVLAFLGLMLALIPFADTPVQVVDGRSTILFAIPIFAASLLLAPAASFAFAGLASVELLLFGLSVSYWANSYLYTIGLFFVMAVISWLASRSLERALTQVRANEERTRSILDSITDGVLALAVTDQTVIVDANPSAAQLLKRATRVDLIGQPIETVFAEAAPEDWAIIRSAFWQDAAVAEWPVQIGRVVLTATIVPLHAPQIGSGRAEKYLLMMLRNSTRETEAQRLQAEFSLLLSQGIHTPLGIIEMLGTDLCERHATLTPAARQSAAATLLEQTRRLKQTVSDLIDRDQLSRRRLDVNLAAVSLPQCLTEIEQSVRQQAAGQGVRVTLKHLPLSPDRVTTDVRLLVQAGRNLVYHLLAQTHAAEITVRVGRKDLTHWVLQVTDYPDDALPYGPLLSGAPGTAPEPTVNWLLAQQVVTALQGELQVGQIVTGQTVIQVVFDGLGHGEN